MSGKGFLQGSVTVSVRMLLAIVCVVVALHVAGVILYFAADVGPVRERWNGPLPDHGNAAGTTPRELEAELLSSYAAVIRPLLDAKCAHCHGEDKQKGGLSLASEETILRGGKRGPALDRAAPEKSLMLARIELALDEDKHMPPEDEDQLAPQELATLHGWIQAGAPFAGVVEGLPAAAVAVQSAPVAELVPENAALAAANPAALAALEAALVHVQPVSQDSRLLWVDFAAAAKTFDDVQTRPLLEPLREQLAELSLARSRVGDETLALLAGFERLRRLDVRATAIGNRGVSALAAHAGLEELVLSQNALTDDCVDDLIAMPLLRKVHLWRSGISPEGIARLRTARPELSIDDGNEPASVALEVETTIELTKAAAPSPTSTRAINAKCPVTGAAVNAKYTIVHEGKAIGFCCPECPKEFWAEPAKFADRVQ